MEYCSDDGHMEEEVQLKVQVEEERIGERHREEQGDEEREREQTTLRRMTFDDHADDMTRTNTFLSHAV